MAKSKFPLQEAEEIAKEILAILEPFCLKIQIAGSIRRRKPLVGDIEILYIPKSGEAPSPGSLFADLHSEDICEEKIKALITEGKITLRKKSDGTTAFGKKVKLLEVLPKRMPLDLFTCNALDWSNNLVSRTGGKDSNIVIASAALSLGLEWMPFGPGFRISATGEIIPVTKEEDAFAICKLPYLPPELRP